MLLHKEIHSAHYTHRSIEEPGPCTLKCNGNANSCEDSLGWIGGHCMRGVIVTDIQGHPNMGAYVCHEESPKWEALPTIGAGNLIVEPNGVHLITVVFAAGRMPAGRSGDAGDGADGGWRSLPRSLQPSRGKPDAGLALLRAKGGHGHRARLALPAQPSCCAPGS